MNLENWLRSGHLLKHEATVPEVEQLLAVVEREVSDASVAGLSPEGRFVHAYNAALQLCTVALHASGYAVGKGQGKHHHLINSLEHTLGSQQTDNMVYLSRCSSLRSQSIYERAGVLEQTDADDLLQLAKQLRSDVLSWLSAYHPDLLPPAGAAPSPKPGKQKRGRGKS